MSFCFSLSLSSASFFLTAKIKYCLLSSHSLLDILFLCRAHSFNDSHPPGSLVAQARTSSTCIPSLSSSLPLSLLRLPPHLLKENSEMLSSRTNVTSLFISGPLPTLLKKGVRSLTLAMSILKNTRPTLMVEESQSRSPSKTPKMISRNLSTPLLQTRTRCTMIYPTSTAIHSKREVQAFPPVTTAAHLLPVLLESKNAKTPTISRLTITLRRDVLTLPI
ncbi:hypothetical protein VTO42DRAFT_925 [Malbranchea cinnamomea]